VCLAGNDRRRGALRFRNIAGSSRYQVDKTMGDRLARGGADVYADVEAFHSGIPGNNIIAKLAQKFVDGQYLREVQIEIHGNMPTGQNERMEGRHGMSISNCKYEFSACHEGRWINRTKWACRRN
jgi:hypothetical protein